MTPKPVNKQRNTLEALKSREKLANGWLLRIQKMRANDIDLEICSISVEFVHERALYYSRAFWVETNLIVRNIFERNFSLDTLNKENNGPY